VEFDTGQLLPDALVRAPAERDMVRRPAGEVELLGLGERQRIPVGGRQGRDDALTGADGLGSGW
jgi:hypothetical protein